MSQRKSSVLGGVYGLACVVWVFAAAQADATETTPLEQALSMRGFAWVAPYAASGADAGFQEIGGVSLAVFHALETVSEGVFPAGEDGQVVIRPSALPEPVAGSLGIWASFQFVDPGSGDGGKKRVGYQLIPLGVRDAEVRLKPPGVATTQAQVEFRPALPSASIRSTAAFTLPEGVRLSLAIGLQNDWRAPRESGSRFLVQVRTEATGAVETVLDETVFAWQERDRRPLWSEFDLGLEKWAGKEIALVFVTEPVAGTPHPTLAYPLWGDVLLYRPEQPLAPPPPVILISLDTLRADRLGCYGYDKPTSPHIDAFAQECVLFEEARSPSSMTTPVHASVMTGVSPAAHRAGFMSEGFVLPPSFPVLAERFKNAHYLTAAFTEGVALRGSLGFARGFDRYSDGPNPESQRGGAVEETYPAALKWLERYGHFPFFLFLHTYEIHAPYDPPVEWLEKFVNPDYSGEPIDEPESADSEAERQYIRQRYDAGIAYTDDWFGRLVDSLRASGVLDRAWVILFSDHGEEFWEHGGCGHARTLYEEVLRVPLMIRPPGGAKPARRIAHPVLLTDVYATALEAAGLKTGDVSSLMGFVEQGEDAAYERERFNAYFKSAELQDEIDVVDGRYEMDLFAVKEGPWKYLLRGVAPLDTPTDASLPSDEARAELYNLDEDPGETRTRLEDAAGIAARMRAALATWYARALELHIQQHHGSGREMMSEEDVEALKALGYLE